MELELIRTLMDYHYWANQRLLQAIDALTPEQFTRDLGSSFPSVQATLAHMMNAETVWLGRLTGEKLAGVAPTDVPTATTVRERWADIEQQMRVYLMHLTPQTMNETITAKASTGAQFTHPAWEVPHQLSNHGTYHRGQLTTMLRQLGASAVSTDLIIYYRVRSGQLQA